MALRGPTGILPQTQRRIHGILARRLRNGKGQLRARCLAGNSLQAAFAAFHPRAILRQLHQQHIVRRIREQGFVFHGNARLVGQDIEILVAAFRLGKFWRGRAVGEQQAVSHEFKIRRAIPEVSAAGEAAFAQAVVRFNPLVHPVPDKSALILRDDVCHTGVTVHRAAGIPHGMHVFAHNKGLFRMFFKESGHISGRGIHLALHIAGIRVTPVMEHSLVMHQPGGVRFAEKAAHFVDVPASEALVAAAPDEHRGMVFIPLEHTVCPVKHSAQPLRPVAGKRALRSVRPLPRAVRLQVRLVDHIKAVLVAQVIPFRAVGIMAGAHGVDIVLLHGPHIAHHILHRYGSARAAVPLMAVHALEHDAPAVEQHQAVPQLKPAEAGLSAHGLQKMAGRVGKRYLIGVKLRRLGAPQTRAFHGQLQHRMPARHRGQHRFSVQRQRRLAHAHSLQLQLRTQRTRSKIF